MTNDTNEIEFMTGETDFDKAAAILRERWPNIRLLNVTAAAPITARCASSSPAAAAAA